MFVVSYVIVFAFYPKLNLDCVIFQRSFGHSLKKLTTIDYLNNDHMECIEVKLVRQLKDCTICVSQKLCKNKGAQMFTVELRFVADYFLTWFNKKFRSQHLEIDFGRKIAHKAKNPINWYKDKCYICNFLMQINAKGLHVANLEMSYTDFYIRFEHKFLRNLYSREELASSAHLGTLENHYKVFDKFLTVVILLESTLSNNLTFSEIVYDELMDFLKGRCTDCQKFREFNRGYH